MRINSVRISLLAILVLWSCTLPLAAQEPPSEEPPSGTPAAAETAESPLGSFSEVVDVHVVSVEVVVTDKQGRPVTDLTREDFQVIEDGEPMALTNFFAVEGRPSGAPGPMPEPRAPAPAATAAALPEDTTQELQLVVVIDNLQIRPENRKKLFDQLRQYLRHNDDLASRISVATMNTRLQISLPFTDDLDRVFEVLDEQERKTSYQALFDGERRMMMARLQNASLRRYAPREATIRGQTVQVGGDGNFNDAVRVAMEMADNVRSLGERRYQMTRTSIQALGSLCATLGGLPGRKALLYLSDGLPQRPADSLAQAWLDKYDAWTIEVDNDIRQFTVFREAPGRFREILTMGISNNYDLHHELEALAEQASVNRVTFYPISVAGRGTTGFMSAEHTGSGGVASNTGSVLRASTTIENFTRDSSLLLLAEDTGGVALLRSANLDHLLDRMRQDFQSFYSLGYSPPHGGKDNDFHRVKVKLLRDGLEVRHVEGYRNKNWRKSLGELTLAAALYGAESNPLGVRLDRGEPIADGKNFVVPIEIKIPFELIRMVHQDQHFKAQLTVLVMVSDEEDG
ncbi:MAG: VWA domain-containing protein, partial [Thermoanaerobaculia bacterium]